MILNTNVCKVWLQGNRVNRIIEHTRNPSKLYHIEKLEGNVQRLSYVGIIMVSMMNIKHNTIIAISLDRKYNLV